MFWELVTVTAAIAAVAVTGASDMPQPGPRGLHISPNGLTDDNTDVSRIADSDIILQHQKSMAEQSDLAGNQELQSPATNITTGEEDVPKLLAGSENTRAKGCPQRRKCLNKGGTCVPRWTCVGEVITGCKRDCDCCITSKDQERQYINQPVFIDHVENATSLTKGTTKDICYVNWLCTIYSCRSGSLCCSNSPNTWCCPSNYPVCCNGGADGCCPCNTRCCNIGGQNRCCSV